MLKEIVQITITNKQSPRSLNDNPCLSFEPNESKPSAQLELKIDLFHVVVVRFQMSN